jgi:hypothetical protein
LKYFSLFSFFLSLFLSYAFFILFLSWISIVSIIYHWFDMVNVVSDQLVTMILDFEQHVPRDNLPRELSSPYVNSFCVSFQIVKSQSYILNSCLLYPLYDWITDLCLCVCVFMYIDFSDIVNHFHDSWTNILLNQSIIFWIIFWKKIIANCVSFSVENGDGGSLVAWWTCAR